MMYPHIVTVWRRVEEGRSVSWKRTVFQRCRLEPTYGASPGDRGDSSERSADLIVKSRGKAALGIFDHAQPPKDAFVVESVSMVSINGAPLHWEAELR